MKFTDKFVLVPIERYERLTKLHSSKDENELNKEILQKGNGITNETSETDKTNQILNSTGESLFRRDI